MGFSRQQYWSVLPFLSPGDLPDPGIKPVSLMSPALALALALALACIGIGMEVLLPLVPPGKPRCFLYPKDMSVPRR